MRNSYPYTVLNIFEKQLESSKILQDINHNIKTIIKLNDMVNNLIPYEIKKACRVVNYRNNIMTIEVASASYLFRINYVKKNIFFALKKNILPSLTFIKLKINPNLTLKTKNILVHEVNNQKTKITKIKKISVKTANNFLVLAKKSPKCLKEMLERLAALSD